PAAACLLDISESFAGPTGPDRIEHLRAAARNDLAVLELAHRVAAPLRADEVPGLRPRPGAEEGQVRIHVAEARGEEVAHIAESLAQVWRPGETSAAVLCRKRTHFDAVENALTQAGIPCEIVGLSGLLATPEVADV